MKARRTVENGFYINEIPEGSLGDVSADPHMREIPYPEAEQITFFIYEEIAACVAPASRWGLGRTRWRTSSTAIPPGSSESDHSRTRSRKKLSICKTKSI